MCTQPHKDDQANLIYRLHVDDNAEFTKRSHATQHQKHTDHNAYLTCSSDATHVTTHITKRSYML